MLKRKELKILFERKRKIVFQIVKCLFSRRYRRPRTKRWIFFCEKRHFIVDRKIGFRQTSSDRRILEDPGLGHHQDHGRNGQRLCVAGQSALEECQVRFQTKIYYLIYLNLRDFLSKIQASNTIDARLDHREDNE